MTSSSTNSGVVHDHRAPSTSTRNPDLAAVDVQNRVNQALGRLPDEVRTNGITVTKKHAPASWAASASSRRTTAYDSLFISNYLDVYVRDALKRVPGVGDVIIFGERKYAMRLWLDPARLAARGLTAGDVVRRAARAERAGGGRRARRRARAARTRSTR